MAQTWLGRVDDQAPRIERALSGHGQRNLGIRSQPKIMTLAHHLKAEGIKPAEIAKRVSLGRSTVYRLLSDTAPVAT